MNNKKILVTGAGAPGGPGIIKALQKAGHTVFGGDADNEASGRFVADGFVQLPLAGNDDFISFVLKQCIENGIEVVFPLVTRELFHFAANKLVFDTHGIKVIVSANEGLQIANNKGRLYVHLEQQGISVPHFKIVTSVDDLVIGAKYLGYPDLPVCVKPTVSNGSRGVRILQEGLNEFELLFQNKPNHLYTTLKQFCSIINGRVFPELLVAEYLPGPEYTIDAIVANGDVKLLLPRSRDKMNGGISIRGTFVQHKEIMDYCRQVLQSLPLHGPIGLQVKAAVDGSFKLLEINPRIQGTSTAALGMGINLPALVVEQEFGTITIDENTIPWGTSFVRYYDELFY